MLRYLSSTTKKIEELTPSSTVDPNGIWFDLYNPTPEEIKWIEESLSLSIPTSEEMQEIEYSSRLYQEKGASFMTMNVITSFDSTNPISSPITFILTQNYLVTLRYVDPKAFSILAQKAQKNVQEELSPALLFLTLLELIVDRIADMIEAIGGQIDHISRNIFEYKSKGVQTQNVLQDVVTLLGKQGDLSTKVRLSLENMNRLLKFIQVQGLLSQQGERLAILGQDVHSITEHITFMFHKINFLLDATLGLINIEQNAVVKILSGAAVIFLPPTLIASIYGMNFASMPELHSVFGYPIILIIMLLSSILPYLYFKRKGWLH